MKKVAFILSSLLLLSMPFAYAQETAEGGPEFKFEAEVHDFGTVIEGEKARHEFKFKNVGTEPLIISSVKASCGCTTPTWPKEPIAPGEESSVVAIYNSKGRPNAFNKAITITSNAKTSRKVLYIKGNVVKEENIESPIFKEQSGPTEQKSN